MLICRSMLGLARCVSVQCRSAIGGRLLLLTPSFGSSQPCPPLRLEAGRSVRTVVLATCVVQYPLDLLTHLAT